ncbi:hypothetical protein [Effusibacillus consociatus]|uniref:PepSY domain-containing protein n=1 Tax=Effusibacillus consociatus TaxID=1117041 RepID=A0ABV9Q9X3_9BACL
MLKKIYIVLSVLLIVFILPAAVIGTINADKTHWTRKDIDDKTIIPLPHSISTIKEGLPFANKRASEWRKDAELSYVVVRFEGKDAIKNRKGVIAYRYYVKNKSLIGLPHAVCYVEIDLDKQSIVRFQAYGSDKLDDTMINIAKWNLDLDDVFGVVEKQLDSNVIDKHSKPIVVIRAFEDFWHFAIFPSPDSHGEELLVVIDPVTKEIKRIDNKSK